MVRDREEPNFTLQDPVAIERLLENEASDEYRDTFVGVLSISDLRAYKAVLTSRDRIGEMPALSRYGDPSWRS